MWGSSDVEYAESGAVGLFGGIVTIWNTEKFSVGWCLALVRLVYVVSSLFCGILSLLYHVLFPFGSPLELRRAKRLSILLRADY
ncbi:hypothetical protein RHGRI_038934 [Rhododendron griersonianum]|uniref:Uncharacterized protein n=1 Tax=Rhododendron griersonianum TaxID=479676 RepID=A0AAV6HIQ3_9ERIC|nr:hypothetical protein RHGRI_038934 [Rhododendron griersonianum]